MSIAEAQHSPYRTVHYPYRTSYKIMIKRHIIIINNILLLINNIIKEHPIIISQLSQPEAQHSPVQTVHAVDFGAVLILVVLRGVLGVLGVHEAVELG